MLPAGIRGEGFQNYDVLNPKSRHHIDFDKSSKDVLNLILLGNLHFSFTKLEPVKNLDYYTRMRYMRNCFEDCVPPSFWGENFQQTYIARLREFISEWRSSKTIRYTDSKTNEKVDFIKVNIRGETYTLQDMLGEGWITEDWINSIIGDIEHNIT